MLLVRGFAFAIPAQTGGAAHLPGTGWPTGSSTHFRIGVPAGSNTGRSLLDLFGCRIDPATPIATSARFATVVSPSKITTVLQPPVWLPPPCQVGAAISTPLSHARNHQSLCSGFHAPSLLYCGRSVGPGVMSRASTCEGLRVVRSSLTATVLPLPTADVPPPGMISNSR